jgi:hypothetical protein
MAIVLQVFLLLLLLLCVRNALASRVIKAKGGLQVKKEEEERERSASTSVASRLFEADSPLQNFVVAKRVNENHGLRAWEINDYICWRATVSLQKECCYVCTSPSAIPTQTRNIKRKHNL